MVDTAKPDTTDPKVAKPKAGLGALPAPDEKLFPLYAVAYTESVRGVTQQAGVLDGARTRAGVLITAANVVTALLATPAIRDRPGGAGLGPGGWLAIAAFVVSMASALYILWPWTGWRFAVSGTGVVDMIEGTTGYNLGGLHRRLAEVNEKSQTLNENRLNGYFSAFRWSCTFITVEVILWVLVLAKVTINGGAL